jgi:hypothetical protein
MGGKLYGADALRTALRNIADKVPENGRKVMHRAADKIVERAKLFCPVDLGNLEDSIHQETTYEGRGRLAIDIVAGGEFGGIDVDAYASEIDENYSSMHPGPGTIAKRNANPGVYIGEHFIDRAVAEQEPKLEAALIEVTSQTMAEEGK